MTHMYDSSKQRLVFTNCIHTLETEYRPMSRREVNRAVDGLIAKDKSWQVVLTAVAIAAANIALFVGWWVG